MSQARMSYTLPIKVFDFFSGCGGTCRGFRNAGMDIVFSLDIDPDAGRSFSRNFPETAFLLEDIACVSTNTLTDLMDECKGHPILFSGGAPCQPFTRQNTERRQDDARARLLCELGRFAKHYEPEFIFVENVPGLQTMTAGEGPLAEFLAMLDELKYHKALRVVYSRDYGVPQRRRRLVLIASRLGPLGFPQETHGTEPYLTAYSTVKEWIGDLPAIAAGETDGSDPIHRAASLSDLNLERMRATPPGGDRRHWPEHLRLKCHSNGYSGHTDVYGRMRWDEPATGLTTRCVSLSNGRFGHPEQDRAISVREAACLQTFPRDTVVEGSLNSMAR